MPNLMQFNVYLAFASPEDISAINKDIFLLVLYLLCMLNCVHFAELLYIFNSNSVAVDTLCQTKKLFLSSANG